MDPTTLRHTINATLSACQKFNDSFDTLSKASWTIELDEYCHEGTVLVRVFTKQVQRNMEAIIHHASGDPQVMFYYESAFKRLWKACHELTQHYTSITPDQAESILKVANDVRQELMTTIKRYC